jgi:hypothetical protein
MSAPLLWILLPLAAAVLTGLVRGERERSIQAGTGAVVLALIAFVVLIDTALVLGPLSLKITASAEVLGRSFGSASLTGR